MRHMSREALEALLQSEDLADLAVPEICQLVRAEKDLAGKKPDALCQIDPRDGALIVYNSSRAKRPHETAIPLPAEPDTKPCPICEGRTTGVIDVAELTKGFTFINKNMFPILYPAEEADPHYLQRSLYEDPLHKGRVSYGMHLLQWTSSFHDLDWHNLPKIDCTQVMKRLAALEKKLLCGSEGIMPRSLSWETEKETLGFVAIIKNYGALVGGSLPHGHQQISYSNIMPRRFYNNWNFFKRHGEIFSNYMLRENPPDLLVREYETASLIVPYFMRRPYDMLLIMKDTDKQYLHELNEQEIADVASGWHDAILSMLTIMPLIGRTPAYNVTVSNGPGAGLYFDFLPYTQEKGGFEHLGLWVCQDNPANVAERLRHLMQEHEEL